MSTEIELTFPEASARLVGKPQGYLWIVDVCPLCGQRHVHGGGPLDGDPNQLLGHRDAHCAPRAASQPSGYILVAAPDQEAP
jgi:hypothetical protein